MINKATFRISVGDDGSSDDRKGKMVLTATIAQGPAGDVVEALVLDTPEDDAYLASLVARMEARIADPDATPVITGESKEDRKDKLELAAKLRDQQAAKELRISQANAVAEAAKKSR